MPKKYQIHKILFRQIHFFYKPVERELEFDFKHVEEGQKITFGRGDDNDFICPSSHPNSGGNIMSNSHGTLEKRGNELYYLDHSKYGTKILRWKPDKAFEFTELFINKNEFELLPGDWIFLCDVVGGLIIVIV